MLIATHIAEVHSFNEEVYSSDEGVEANLQQKKKKSPSAHAMLIGPHVAEVHSSNEEDDPQSQQNQQAVTHGHHTLIVSVICCVRLSCGLSVIQVVAVTAKACTQLECLEQQH